MAQRPLVLASTSPYRRELMQRLRLAFDTVAPDCDERARAGESAGALVERLAEAKARSVVPLHPEALIVGSDQVAALDGRILTKPGTPERAAEQLAACSGRRVVFHTGLAVVDARAGTAAVERVEYRVDFRVLGRDAIERYLAADAPYDCAGGIRAEGYAVTLFEAMDGADPSALVGLPLIRLAALLRDHGLALP